MSKLDYNPRVIYPRPPFVIGCYDQPDRRLLVLHTEPLEVEHIDPELLAALARDVPADRWALAGLLYGPPDRSLFLNQLLRMAAENVSDADLAAAGLCRIDQPTTVEGKG